MTTEILTQSNLETLQAFGDAWNRHDLDGIMSYMTEDCVFYSPAGPELMGKAHRGQAAVRAEFETGVFTTIKDFEFKDVNYVVNGDQGHMSWTLIGTLPDGAKAEIPGVDLITFRGGKISAKNALVKAKI